MLRILIIQLSKLSGGIQPNPPLISENMRFKNNVTHPRIQRMPHYTSTNLYTAMYKFIAILVLSVFGWAIVSNLSSSDKKESNNTAVAHAETGSDYRFERHIERDGINSASLELNVSAGELYFSGGTEGLLDVYNSYNKKDFEPELSIVGSNADHKSILIESKRERASRVMNWGSNNVRNEWDVKINPDVVYDMKINAGAGKCEFDLADTRISGFSLQTGASSAEVNLRNTSVEEVNIKSGVGSFELDLSGERQNDLFADIKGGVGSVTIYVPEDYGVRFTAAGLGSVNADGFYREGRYYQNDSYGKTDHTIDIDIAGGIGSVDVIQI